MGEGKATVEVELIARDCPEVKNWLDEVEVEQHAFFAAVLSYEEGEDGYRSMEISYQDRGFIIKHIDLQDFWIVSSTFTFGDLSQGSISDVFAMSDQDQEDAFDIIKQFLVEENVAPLRIEALGGEDTVSLRSTGPKRLQVELKNGSGKLDKVILTDVVEPAGSWNHYTLTGKIIEEGVLTGGIGTYHSGGWKIFRIDIILGNSGGAAVEHYSGSNTSQNSAWSGLVAMWGRFKTHEKSAVKNWSPVGTEVNAGAHTGGFGQYSYSGNNHWTNRTPSAYNTKPEAAHFRVRGDEVGAILFREQSGALGNPMAMEDALKYMEKKDEAEAAEESSADTRTGSGNTDVQSDAASSIDGSALCACTGAEFCEDCEDFQQYGFSFGGSAITH